MSRALAMKDGKLTWEKPKSKYNAKPQRLCLRCTTLIPDDSADSQCYCAQPDIKRFASKRELNRYLQLRMQEKAGVVRAIELQPAFTLTVNGQVVCKYVADFAYTNVMTGKRVIEDVKSKATRTPVYILKAKLLKAIKGIEVVEV